MITNYLCPFFKIYIDGKELDKERYQSIEDIEIYQTIDGSDTCSFSIVDKYSLFIEDDIFVEETSVLIKIGVHEYDISNNFHGYISAIDIDFPESGVVSLSVLCMDNSHKMNRQRKTRSWENIKSIGIADTIRKEYGFKILGRSNYSFKHYENKTQTDSTDLNFIESLIGEELVPCYTKMVDHETLAYETIDFVATPRYELVYKIDPYTIISFNPTINRETLQANATKREIDIKKKESAGDKVDFNGDSPVTQGKKIQTFIGPSGRGTTVALPSNPGLIAEAKKDLMEKELLTLVGDIAVHITSDTLSMKVTDVITLKGLGRFLSGDYLITGIKKHISTSGFSITLTVIKTGFGNSVKSERLFSPSLIITEVEEETKEKGTSGGGGSGKPDLSGAEHTTLQFTAYTHTGNATASGVMPRINHTCASWSGLPFGTKIYVPSRNCTYTVEDRGGAVTYGIIDLFMDTEYECIQFGRRDLEAYIIRK